MRLSGKIGTALPTLAVVAPFPAAADPVTVQVVTSGQASASEGNNGFVLIGTGFVLRGEIPTLGDVVGACFQSPCFPGRTLTLDDEATPHLSSVNAETLEFGDTYEEAFLTGDLVFSGGPIVVPEVSLDGFVTVGAPFSFAGMLLAFDNFLAQGNPLFTANLIGSGTATVDFTNSLESGIIALNVNYEFEQTAPVPEPASLMLVASGLAGLVAARRRRRADYRSGMLRTSKAS